MVKLPESGLRILANLHTPITFEMVPAHRDDGQWWKMLIHIADRNEHAVLVNVFGEERVWRQLNAAAKFIFETCPDIEAFTVSKHPKGQR